MLKAMVLRQIYEEITFLDKSDHMKRSLFSDQAEEPIPSRAVWVESGEKQRIDHFTMASLGLETLNMYNHCINTN